MKTTLLIVICLFMLNSCSEHKSPHNKSEIVITKDGFGEYKIGETKINEVIKDYGTNYEKIRDPWCWGDQITYKDLGLSFSYGTGDIIRAIEFYPPFHGITDKGIVLNVSTMEDVERIYDSLDWYISAPWEEWCSMHPGIEYCVIRDTTLPKWPLDETLHIERKITRIVAIDNYDEFD